jgi:pimeloyl-ACP methyl ester carboxylesterase
MTQQIQLNQIEANGVNFSYLECGSGPIALCMHGFPDSAHTWRYLMPELAQAG